MPGGTIGVLFAMGIQFAICIYVQDLKKRGTLAKMTWVFRLATPSSAAAERGRWFGQEMVRLGRLERPTSCFGGTRSIQLSYSRVVPLYHAGLVARIPVLNF